MSPAQASFWRGFRGVVPDAPERFTPGKYRCPQCSKNDRDRRLQVGYNDRDHEVWFKCWGGCDRNELRKLLRVPSWTALYDDRSPKQGTLLGEYTYTDEQGIPLFRVTRWTDPASQRYQHQDDSGTWALAPKGWKHPWVLYRARNVVEAIEAEETVYFCASEADADAIHSHGGTGTAIPEAPGKGGFRVEYAEQLRGAYVVVVAVKTEMARERARMVAAALSGRVADVRVVEPAILGEGKTARDHLAAGGILDDFAPLTSQERGGHKPGSITGPPPRATLTEVEKRYAAVIENGDQEALRGALATYAANRWLPGDPVWTGLISGSSTGKTETATALGDLPDVFVKSTLSGEPALLSATPEKDRADDATGGVLRQVGDLGVIVLKDFTSILGMDRHKRGQILSALREAYDGSWTRDIGGEGGRTLEWAGKLGLIMCCTTSYDRAYAVVSEMGDRFLLLRLIDGDRRQSMRSALKGDPPGPARRDLAQAVAGLLGNPPEHPPLEPTDAELDDFAELADFVTLARSPVARDYAGEVELIHDPEGPYRFGKALFAVWRACGLLGLGKDDAWDIVFRIARDSMPKLRWLVLEALAKGERGTGQVSRAVWHPTKTTRRALEDLTAHRIVRRTPARQARTRDDQWRLSEQATGPVTVILDRARNVAPRVEATDEPEPEQDLAPWAE